MTSLRDMSNAEFLAGMVQAGIIKPIGNPTEADIAKQLAEIEPLRLYLADKMDAAKPHLDAAQAKRDRKAAKRARDAKGVAKHQALLEKIGAVERQIDFVHLQTAPMKFLYDKHEVQDAIGDIASSVVREGEQR